MTKEELKKFKDIEGEIEQIRKELKKVEPEYTKDAVTGSEPCHPYVAHQVKIEGYDYNSFFRKVRKIEKRLNEKLNEMIDTKDKITEYIYNYIPDSELRQIFTYKYLEGLTWSEIGKKMNYGTSTVRYKHDTFIKNDKV